MVLLPSSLTIRIGDLLLTIFRDNRHIKAKHIYDRFTGEPGYPDSFFNIMWVLE